MTPTGDSDRIKTLFLGALELDAEARADYLDKHCNRDSSLRGRLDDLLIAHDEARGFLAEPGSVAVTGEEPGAIVGRYKLLQKIGEGGFGFVWMAEQQEPVRRKVALKIIKLGMDTKQVIARFEAERQALARMDHPNIAKVLDGGATESGRPFFVMELVRGVPITEYCDEAKLSTRERLELFILVCFAVHHAHQKGIIHRDIKPSNVMVTLHDGQPVPMVIDFGIAKATSGSLTEKTLFTEFRQFLGTPEYMSPEQAEISGLDIDTRADVYSLGVLLYELLTGTTPVDPAQLRSAAYEELLRLIREEEPPKPSTRVSTLGKQQITVAQARATEPNALQRLMRGDLDWVVMKALEKERTRRYESAASFAQDIRRHLEFEPVSACPPSRIYRTAKFVRRNRIAVVAGCLVALALVVGAGAATVEYLRAERGLKHAIAAESRALVAAREAGASEERAQAEADNASQAEAREREERKHATAEAEAARLINSFYDDMLLSIDPLRMRQRSGFMIGEGMAHATAPAFDRDVSVAEMLRGAAATVDDSFGGKPKLEAKVRETIGVTFLGLGLSEDAGEQLSQAVKLLEEMPEDREADLLRLELLRGAASFEEGKFDAAERQVRGAMEGMRRVHGQSNARSLHAASLLGRVLMHRGKYDEAQSVLEVALADQRRLLTEGHRDTVDTLNNLAVLYLWQSNPLDAEPYAREAYEISARILNSDDIVRVNAETSLGIILEFQMDYEPAEKMLRTALEKQRRLTGPRHQSTVGALYHLARCLTDDADQVEQEKLLREALAITRQIGGPLDYSVRRDLALFLFDTGQLDEAVVLIRENVESVKAGEDVADDRLLEAMWFLRTLLEETGQLDEAELTYREVVDVRLQTIGEDHVWTCSALASLCKFLRRCGKLEEAQDAWQDCLDLRFRLTEREGGSKDSYGHLGRMLLHPEVPGMRNVEDAIAFLELGLPEGLHADCDQFSNLTLAYLLVGRDEDAATIAVRDIEHTALHARSGKSIPLLAHARLLLGCLVEELRDPTAALQFIRQAIERDSGDRDAWRLLALAEKVAGHSDAARRATARWIELHASAVEASKADPRPVQSYLWSLVSTEYDELRPETEVERMTSRLVKKSANVPTRLLAVGLARYRLGQYREAIVNLSDSDTLNIKQGLLKNPALTRVVLAMCRYKLGETEAAQALMQANRAQIDNLDFSFEEREELRSMLREAQSLMDPGGERGETSSLSGETR